MTGFRSILTEKQFDNLTHDLQFKRVTLTKEFLEGYGVTFSPKEVGDALAEKGFKVCAGCGFWCDEVDDEHCIDCQSLEDDM